MLPFIICMLVEITPIQVKCQPLKPCAFAFQFDANYSNYQLSFGNHTPNKNITIYSVKKRSFILYKNSTNYTIQFQGQGRFILFNYILANKTGRKMQIKVNQRGAQIQFLQPQQPIFHSYLIKNPGGYIKYYLNSTKYYLKHLQILQLQFTDKVTIDQQICISLCKKKQHTRNVLIFKPPFESVIYLRYLPSTIINIKPIFQYDQMTYFEQEQIFYHSFEQQNQHELQQVDYRMIFFSIMFILFLIIWLVSQQQLHIVYRQTFYLTSFLQFVFLFIMIIQFKQAAILDGLYIGFVCIYFVLNVLGVIFVRSKYNQENKNIFWLGLINYKLLVSFSQQQYCNVYFKQLNKKKEPKTKPTLKIKIQNLIKIHQILKKYLYISLIFQIYFIILVILLRIFYNQIHNMFQTLYVFITVIGIIVTIIVWERFDKYCSESFWRGLKRKYKLNKKEINNWKKQECAQRRDKTKEKLKFIFKQNTKKASIRTLQPQQNNKASEQQQQQQQHINQQIHTITKQDSPLQNSHLSIFNYIYSSMTEQINRSAQKSFLISSFKKKLLMADEQAINLYQNYILFKELSQQYREIIPSSKVSYFYQIMKAIRFAQLFTRGKQEEQVWKYQKLLNDQILYNRSIEIIQKKCQRNSNIWPQWKDNLIQQLFTVNINKNTYLNIPQELPDTNLTIQQLKEYRSSLLLSINYSQTNFDNTCQIPDGMKNRLKLQLCIGQAQVNDLLQEYRRFLQLSKRMRVVPSSYIDQVWHMHLNYPKHYLQHANLNHHPSSQTPQQNHSLQKTFKTQMKIYSQLWGQIKNKIWQKDNNFVYINLYKSTQNNYKDLIDNLVCQGRPPRCNDCFGK